MDSIVLIALLTSSVSANIGVAIVGGGISGTSTAYFLSQLLGERVTIDIYEGSTVGGRLSTVRVDGCEYETGGSIIHERNRYATILAERMGLKKKADETDEIIALTNGKEYSFIGSKYPMVNAGKMLWRYGWDLIRLQRYTNELLSRFDRVYEIQDRNESYVELNELMAAIDPVLLHYMNESTWGGFTNDEYSPRIIEELILATLKCNYGQTTTVHRFVGSVSVAGAGYNLYSLEGGNKMLAHSLLEASGAHVISDSVQSILFDSAAANHKFLITTKSGLTSPYDIVIVSTPLTQDPERHQKINFYGFPNVITVPGNYWTTVATIVKGNINPKYFEFESADDVPDLIISTSDSTPFNSIGKIRPVADQKTCEDGHIPVWKIFSKLPLTDIQSMFESIKFHHQIDWLAYPNYNTKQDSYCFTLHEGLFYTNAMEWSASAIETSIIGARNVALLVKKHIDGGAEPSKISNSQSEFSALHDEM